MYEQVARFGDDGWVAIERSIGFAGCLNGGVVFVRTGSYDAVWWLSILFGLLSAVINLPIVEKPVVRAAAVPA